MATAFQDNGFQHDAFQIVDAAFQKCAFQYLGFQTDPCPAILTSSGTAGGGRKSRLSVKGTKSYLDPYRRDKQQIRMERGIIEFVVRFTTEFL